MPSLEDNTTQVEADTDNRHIMSMKSQGFFRTPQDIMIEYNGCPVPQYTRYPLNRRNLVGSEAQAFRSTRVQTESEGTL